MLVVLVLIFRLFVACFIYYVLLFVHARVPLRRTARWTSPGTGLLSAKAFGAYCSSNCLYYCVLELLLFDHYYYYCHYVYTALLSVSTCPRRVIAVASGRPNPKCRCGSGLFVHVMPSVVLATAEHRLVLP